MSEMVDKIIEAMKATGCDCVMWDREPLEEVARAMIEAMRAVPDVCYDHYRCDKLWRELNSTEVWNLWLDAALKD